MAVDDLPIEVYHYKSTDFQKDQRVAVVHPNPLKVEIQTVIEVTPAGHTITSGGYVFLAPYGICYTGHTFPPGIQVITDAHNIKAAKQECLKTLSCYFDFFKNALRLRTMREIIRLWNEDKDHEDRKNKDPEKYRAEENT